MIVLDTNQLKHCAFPHGPILGVLRKIAALHNRRLALPEMVVVEHVAHHRNETETTLNVARKALATLGKSFNSDLLSPLDGLSPEGAAKGRRSALEAVFDVLPTPAGAADEALRREANRLPPAEQQWKDPSGKEVKARGARDVAIWLTLMDAATSTDGDVWYLTLDQDFGKEDFHPALRDEARQRLGEKSDRLRLLPGGITQLLGELAAVAPTPDNLPELLEDPKVVHAVAVEVTHSTLYMSLMYHATRAGWIPNAAIIHASIDKIRRSNAYAVGDSTWVSTQLTWHGYILRDGTPDAGVDWRNAVYFALETTVLLETRGETVLDADVMSAAPATALGTGEARVGGSGWNVTIPLQRAEFQGPDGNGWAMIQSDPDAFHAPQA